MGNTRPFTDAHAIAWIDLAILFRAKLSAEQQAYVRANFERILVPEGFEAARADDGGAGAFERKGIAGEVTEEVHIHEQFVHLIWNEYRGWTFTLDAALKRVGFLLEDLRDGRIEPAGMGLAVRDVFFNDDPDTYQILDVFGADSRFIPRIAYECDDESWRQSVSYWDARKDNPIYSSVSIQARVAYPDSDDEDKHSDTDDEGIHVTEIVHRQSIYGNKDAESAVEWSMNAVRERWSELHQRNKKLMFELLSDEMISTIGLRE